MGMLTQDTTALQNLRARVPEASVWSGQALQVVQPGELEKGKAGEERLQEFPLQLTLVGCGGLLVHARFLAGSEAKGRQGKALRWTSGCGRSQPRSVVSKSQRSRQALTK